MRPNIVDYTEDDRHGIQYVLSERKKGYALSDMRMLIVVKNEDDEGVDDDNDDYDDEKDKRSDEGDNEGSVLMMMITI